MNLQSSLDAHEICPVPPHDSSTHWVQSTIVPMHVPSDFTQQPFASSHLLPTGQHLVASELRQQLFFADE
jgi:hypothetical protein